MKAYLSSIILGLFLVIVFLSFVFSLYDGGRKITDWEDCNNPVTDIHCDPYFENNKPWNKYEPIYN